MNARHAVAPVCAAILWIAFGSPALARTECDRNARVCLDVPDHWIRSQNGDTITIASPDRAMALELRAVTQISQLVPTRQRFEQGLGSRFQNLQWATAPTPVQQHGMQGVVRRGRGNFPNGEGIGFFMLMLGHDAGGVVGLGIVTDRNIQTNWPIMNAVLNSIRRM
jgi:hypothetical protein